jgi:hypothetical protein
MVMDIRGITKILNPFNIQGKDKVEKNIKFDNTHEREGNGQMHSGNDSEHRDQPMNDEQFEQALEHLKKHQVFKDNNLELIVQKVDSKRFVILREANGKVLRRIPESELWSLQSIKDNEKGQLLSKSA